MQLIIRNNVPTRLAQALFVATLLTLQVVQPAAAEVEIFKSVNEDGIVVFTDSDPDDTSTSIAQKELDVSSEPSLGAAETAVEEVAEEAIEEYEAEPADPRPTYVNSVVITNPTHEEILINPKGAILVGIETSPENGLPEGHTTEVRLNGTPVASGESTLLAVPIPSGGTHTVEAAVLDSNGNEQAKSDLVTIHVKKSYLRDAD